MDNAHSYCMVLTTCPNQEEGDGIAGLLIEQRLAACVQMMDITSRYLWKGTVNKDRETLLIIKARRSNYAKIESCILSNHSYDVPEIVMIPIEKGSAAYLGWIDEVSVPEAGT